MNARKLAELDCVDQKRYVAMPCQPDSVVLIIDFCAPWSRRMTAEVNHRGQPALDFLRKVKVPRYIEARHGLKLDFFDSISVALELSGDAGSQRRLLRHRIQAEHIKHLPANLRTLALPVFKALHIGEVVPGDFAGAAYQIILEHLIPLLSTARTAAIRLRLGGGERRGGKECRQDQYGSHTGTVL